MTRRGWCSGFCWRGGGFSFQVSYFARGIKQWLLAVVRKLFMMDARPFTTEEMLLDVEIDLSISWTSQWAYT